MGRLGWIHRSAVILVCLLLAFSTAVGAQERYGQLAGRVTDQQQAAMPGVTVTATNTQTGATRTAVSGADGTYRLADLDPGRYTVDFKISGFQTLSATDILVLLGRTYTLDQQMRIGGVTETVTVSETPETRIDLTSVTRSHNVTVEELDRLPKPRSFQSVALAAPGVNQGDIEGGIQVHGASAAENSFTIDGVVTNSLISGGSRQNTVFEYLQEVQVKTSGVDAEYGGALGGVISAVTRSGGNTFHGELHSYYAGSGLGGVPIKRLVLDPADLSTVAYFQDTTPADHRNEFGGSIGGPIIRNRLTFFGSISPRVIRRTLDYGFSSGKDPGSVSRSQTDWQGFGKVTFSTTNLRANISTLFTPTRATGTPPSYNGMGSNAISSSLASNLTNQSRGFAMDQTNVAGSIDYTLSPRQIVTARLGYFYDDYRDTGVSTTPSYTYQTSSIGQPGVPPDLQGPQGTQNTPRVLLSQHDTTRQAFVQFDYTHMLSALGSHLIKGGWGYRRQSNDVDKAYPGGYVYLYWNQPFTSSVTGATDTGTYGYYAVNDFGTRGTVTADIQNLFVQDTWSVTPRLTLNLGIRTENEKIPTFRPDIRKYAFEFGFADKLAPRVGVNYDLLGNGRVKVSAAWGRYFDWTKYEIARGSFGGDLWHIYYRSLDTLDIASLNLTNMPGRDLWGSTSGFRDLRATYINNTDPNIKPMYQDSFDTGLEMQWGASSIIGAHYVHNSLRRTIEDMGSLVDGDSVYVIGNPGEGQNVLYPPSYAATQPFPTPKPVRQYDALELTLERRFSRNWFASASYTLSRLYGNYTGLANSDEILTPTTGVGSSTAQQQASSIARQGSNSHTAWDIDEILWDARGHLDPQGRLPTDRPHVVKLYGAYQFNFGTQIGAFFYGGSGTPMTTQVIGLDQYAPFVNGRGDMGRTPVLTRTDLLIAHALRLGQQRSVRLELQVLNLFNQKTATHIFNFLNKGAPAGSQTRAANAIDFSKVNLAEGYDYNALILATPEGQGSYDPRYGMADLFQPGVQGQFSVKFMY